MTSDPIIVFPQPLPDAMSKWLTDLETVRSSGPELLRQLRLVLGDMERLHIPSINYYEAKKMVEKLPKI